jgi:hypothetical protein
MRPTLRFGTLRYTSGGVEEEESLLLEVDVAVPLPLKEVPVTLGEEDEVAGVVVGAVAGVGVAL